MNPASCNNTVTPETAIENLGPCRFPSPLKKLHFSKELFKTDSDRVLQDISFSGVMKAVCEGKPLPSFEMAGPRENIFFNPSETKVGIVTCGGLCPGLNDVIRNLVMGLCHSYGVTRVYGFRYGYEGSNGGNGFWEQCAQWQSFQDYPEEMFTTYNFDVWLANNHRHFEHEWMRYASYWLQTYWTDKHGDDAVANVWKNSHAPEDAIAAYMRLYANNSWETMKEELYDYAARMATFDIDGIREYSDGYLGRYSTTLYPTADGYYQVAYADCPETTGFNVIALNVPEGQTTVSADFEGLMPESPLAADDPGEYMDTEVVAGTVDTYNNIGDASDAGWSYGFVALTSGGTRVYSERYAAEAGNASFTVPAGTEQLYFIVQAAPKTYKAHPWDEKDLTDEQWPYKVKFNGTDLLGSVVIDPDAQPTDVTFTYDLSFPATTNGDYTGTTVSVINEGDMEELAQAFVMQPSLIASKIMEANATPAEGQIAFAAVQADGELEYNCTANGLGFWFDKAGNAIGWGDDSYVFAEFNKDTFTFTIGQFPDHCTTGDTYTIREALVYTLNGTQYTATFVFNIRIL